MIDRERLITIDEFHMPQLGRNRKIHIYLPKDYNISNKSYKTLYMHDGQNLFYEEWTYSGSWKVCEALDDYFDKNGQGVILVAIENSPLRDGLGRLDEYSPWENIYIGGRVLSWLEKDKVFGGEGKEYAEFIGETLLPYIENNYRTLKGRSNRIVGGSSMGAFISLYIGYRYPELFGNLALFSPAYWFALDEMKEYLLENNKKEKLKIYMDMGTKETSDHSNEEFPNLYMNSAIEVEEILRENREEVYYKVHEGHKHHEDYWAKRFPLMLDYILG